jgi:DNA polymerase-3 subunit beta
LGSLFTKAGINDIELSFGGSELLISSANSQAGENKINLNIEKTGADNSIVINYRYLLDGLNSVDSEEVELIMTDGNTPCLLQPKSENSNYLYIIMPIRQ